MSRKAIIIYVIVILFNIALFYIVFNGEKVADHFVIHYSSSGLIKALILGLMISLIPIVSPKIFGNKSGKTP